MLIVSNVVLQIQSNDKMAGLGLRTRTPRQPGIGTVQTVQSEERRGCILYQNVQYHYKVTEQLLHISR